MYANKGRPDCVNWQHASDAVNELSLCSANVLRQCLGINVHLPREDLVEYVSSDLNELNSLISANLTKSGLS